MLVHPAAIAADLAPCQPGAVTVTRHGCLGSDGFGALAVIRDGCGKDENIIAQTRKKPPKTPHKSATQGVKAGLTNHWFDETVEPMERRE